MQFRLVHLLFTIGLIAIFFAMRSWWITTEDDRIAGLTPIVLSVVCGVSAGIARHKYSTIFLLAAVAAFATSTSFAIECVFESPATEFLRRHPIDAQYSTDAELNAIAVFIVTVVATLIGVVIGSCARFVRRMAQKCK